MSAILLLIIILLPLCGGVLLGVALRLSFARVTTEEEPTDELAPRRSGGGMPSDSCASSATSSVDCLTPRKPGDTA